MNPSLIPARTRLPVVGATAMALTLPLPAMTALAWVQFAAASTVRHRKDPPTQSRCELLGSMVKGVMKRKSLDDSVIPFRADVNVAPPLVDFWMDSPKFSA